ncbi:MAG: hypothetical protein Q7S22_01335 [Candidatus Micrarchaeota archaeon]|nr:hypothetical protein [Candidatus Micrarchaeota archaeon]
MNLNIFRHCSLANLQRFFKTQFQPLRGIRHNYLLNTRILHFLFGIIFISLVFAEVPEHNPSLDSQCPDGFQWSRGTVSCKQADCPEGAGRTYTYDCNCGEAWDKPFRTCYDPKRPGYAISCVAQGSKCPSDVTTDSGSNDNSPSAESCDYDSECPDGYKCDLSVNRCVQEQKEICDEFQCGAQGGTCKDDKCVVEDKCANVTCNEICSGSILKTNGNCNSFSGSCDYDSELTCKNSCASSGNSCRVYVGKINFIDIDNVIKPLKNIHVFAKWYDELGNLRSTLPDRYSNDNGEVTFSNAELDMYEDGTFEVGVLFEDQGKHIQVVDASSLAAGASDAQLKAAPVAKYTNSLYIDTIRDNLLNLTFDHGMASAKYARIYYHALEAENFMEKGLKVLQKNPPERFYVDSAETSGAVHAGGGAPGAVDQGIEYSPRTSLFENPESPTNREWHEFGHHIMYEAYGYHYCCDTANHAGYANPTSIDSYTEGFAEFMSMMMLDYYNYPKKNLYFVVSTPYNMEINYRVDSTIGGIAMEEMSLASIYYDLLDGGANDEDGIQLTQEQIWSVLSSKHKFGSETRYIHSISDAYRTFNESALPGLHDKWGNAPFFVSKLDRIFIAHGVYSDRNGDRLWEPGEEVGFTLSGGTARPASKSNGLEFNRPPIPGSYIKINAIDEQNGNDIISYPINVSVHVEGQEEGAPVSYDYDFQTIPNADGEININMPPSDYKTTMKFSLGGDKNYEQTHNAFEMTSTDYYSKLNPENHLLGEYNVELKPKSKDILSSLQCCAPAVVILSLFAALLGVYKKSKS